MTESQSSALHSRPNTPELQRFSQPGCLTAPCLPLAFVFFTMVAQPGPRPTTRYPPKSNVTDLAVDPRDPQVNYAATNDPGLLKSTDGDQSWTTINQGFPGTPVALVVTIQPDQPDTILVALARTGLYRSIDGGSTWQSVAPGMNPEAHLMDIMFDPTDPRVIYLADILSGVYHSTNGRMNWLPINDNLRTRAVNKLALFPDGQHLYAATEGEGVYRLDLNGAPPGSISESMVEVESVPATAAEEGTTPTPMSEPAEGGRDLCGGATILPLVLIGLAWTRYHRR